MALKSEQEILNACLSASGTALQIATTGATATYNTSASYTVVVSAGIITSIT